MMNKFEELLSLLGAVSDAENLFMGFRNVMRSSEEMENNVQSCREKYHLLYNEESFMVSVGNDIIKQLIADVPNRILILRSIILQLCLKMPCASNFGRKEMTFYVNIGGNRTKIMLWDIGHDYKDYKENPYLIYLYECTILLIDFFEIVPKMINAIDSIFQVSTKENDTKNSEHLYTPSFTNIIQYSDKNKILKRLHQLIDGHKGADVGATLLKAQLDGYLTRIPTQSEFKSEFNLIGGWSAVHNYMSDNNQNALEKANRIIIFD